MIKAIALASMLFFLADLPRAEASDEDCGKCKAILLAGVRNDLRYANDNEFRSDLRWVVALSPEGRQRYRDGNLGFHSKGMEAILNLSLAGEADEELFAAFKESLMVSELAAWNSHHFERLCLKLVRKDVVKVWQDALQDCGTAERRVRGQLMNIDNESFIVVVRHMPIDAGDAKAVKVKGFSCEGAEPKGAIHLKEGTSIEPFSSLSQAFQRKGKAAVSVTVDVEGQPPLVLKIPAMQEAPLPPWQPPTEFWDVQVNIYGKQDSEGDRWGVNTHDSDRQQLYGKFGKRVTEARVIRNPYESEFVDNGKQVTLNGNGIALHLKLTDAAHKKWSESGDTAKQQGPTFTILVLVHYEE